MSKGGGLSPELRVGEGERGLDGSIVVSAVVALAETNTVLLLAEQVRRLVGHDHGHGGRAASGAAGDDSRGRLHSIMEFR